MAKTFYYLYGLDPPFAYYFECFNFLINCFCQYCGVYFIVISSNEGLSCCWGRSCSVCQNLKTSFTRGKLVDSSHLLCYILLIESSVKNINCFLFLLRQLEEFLPFAAFLHFAMYWSKYKVVLKCLINIQ